MRRQPVGEEALGSEAQSHPEPFGVDAVGYGEKVTRLTLGDLSTCP